MFYLQLKLIGDATIICTSCVIDRLIINSICGLLYFPDPIPDIFLCSLRSKFGDIIFTRWLVTLSNLSAIFRHNVGTSLIVMINLTTTGTFSFPRGLFCLWPNLWHLKHLKGSGTNYTTHMFRYPTLIHCRMMCFYNRNGQWIQFENEFLYVYSWTPKGIFI